MHFSRVTEHGPKTETWHVFPDQDEFPVTHYFRASTSPLSTTTPRSTDVRLAEADMQAYFNVSPPSIHQMVLRLERNRLITRRPGERRSIRLAVAREDLPDLE